MRRVIAIVALVALGAPSIGAADVLAPLSQMYRSRSFGFLRDLDATADGAFVYGCGVGFTRDDGSGALTQIGGVPSDNQIFGPFCRSQATAPDGAHVYAVTSPDRLLAYSRNPLDGSLTLIQTLEEGVAGLDAISNANRVSVSPDGKSVFVTSYYDGLAVFARDALTGQLTHQQQLRNGVGGVSGLSATDAVAVSPDGTSVYAAGYYSDAVAFFSRDPLTGLLTFQSAYVDGVGGVDGTDGAQDVRVSPGGENVYVAGADEDAIAVFVRDSGTGALTFLEVERNGVGGVQGLDGVTTLALSGDGENLYSASPLDDAVAHFSRDPFTGALTYVGVQVNGVGAPGLDGARALLVVGNHLYAVGNQSQALLQFDRDPLTGELSFVRRLRENTFGLNALRALAFSPDGRFLYAVGRDENSLVTDELDLVSGTLSRFDLEVDSEEGVAGLSAPQDVVVSGDGAFVYVAGGGTVSVFSRHPTTGKTEFVEFEQQGVAGVDGLAGVEALALSPDGAHLYAGGRNSIAVFARDAGTGALTYSGRYDTQAGPVSSYSDVDIVVSPDGEHLYAGGWGDEYFTDVDLQIAIHDRDPLTGALTFLGRFERTGGPIFTSVHDMAFSADGSRLYAAQNVLARDPLSGGLTLLEDHPAGLNGVETWPDGMIASPDGAHVYSIAYTEMSDFAREPVGGRLQLAQEKGTGDGGQFLHGMHALAVSPDSRFVIAGGSWYAGWIAVFERVDLCAAAPRNGCLALPGHALLGIRNDSVDKRDRINFKWLQGDATSLGDVGDPIHGTTNYAVCVYDGSGLRASAHAPYGERCVQDRSCWKPTGPSAAPTGIKYNDFYRSPEGLQTLQIRFGAAGVSRLTLKANGTAVPPLPTTSLADPVTAQVVTTDGACWSATFTGSEVKANSSTALVPLSFRALH